jgi:hypothetical protein
MGWLLDTNILSERRKPKPEMRVTAFYDAQPLNGLFISVVSLAEIRFGIELQQDVTRRTELNDWLTLTLRPAFAGRIFIAATALHHGLTVVTRDRSDFDKARVPVFNPWDGSE